MSNNKPYPRRHRIESLVLRGISPLIARLSAAVTVRRISLNGDYSQATVHYALLIGDSANAQQNAQQLLENNAHLLRRQLASALNMRTTPKLVFVLDSEGIAADAMRDKLENISQDSDAA